jgi:hypothetical protein
MDTKKDHSKQFAYKFQSKIFVAAVNIRALNEVSWNLRK